MKNFKALHRIVCAQDSQPLVNMVYAEIGDEEHEILGAFSGIGGGGGLFHQAEGNMHVDDDPGVFETKLEPDEVQEICTELERLRASFESFDDDGNLVALSQSGVEFVNSSASEAGDGYTLALSESASEDFIYDVQDEWNLNFYLE